MTLRRALRRWIRVVVPVLALTWAFGLTALERRRMRSTEVGGTSSPAALLADAASLMNDVKALTGPEMGGRLTGSPGNHRAQAYIIDRFKQSGLQPLHGSYEQRFSFVHHSIRGLVLPGRPFKTTYPDATNLIGALRGSSYPDSWLIVSAHFDHLGVRAGEVYPGADDNASGVSAMLAAASYFSVHPPRHSVLFAAFDAEEEGLQGSRYFVAHPPLDLARVQLLVNLDMVSRGDDGVMVVSGTQGDDRLRALVAGAAATRAIRVQFGHDRPMYLAGRVEDWTQSSDHGPFHDAGVRTLYFGVEDHPDYHRPGDTVERIPVRFFAEATSLVIETLIAADR